MKDCLVYVKRFKKKQDTAPAFEEGRVYKATDDGAMYTIHLPSGDTPLDKEVQSGELFDAEIVSITQENHTDYQYSPEDAELVIKTIVTPIIKQAAKDYNDRQNNIMSEMGADLTDIMLYDSELADAIADSLRYLKQESERMEMFSIDTTPISRHSYAGKGYNIGTALDHLKNYLDRGKRSDLYKSQLCVLNELIRLNNEKDSQA